MKKYIPVLIFVLLISTLCFAQNTPVSKVSSEQDSKQIYIPRNLDECFSELQKVVKTEDLEAFKNKEEDDAVASVHFSWGMWIRNNWGLRAKSRLANYFNDMGVYNPDDMSGIILGAFWCHLNGKQFKLQERIKNYQEYWQYTSVPKDIVSPKDGGEIAFFMSMPCQDDRSKYCRIHLGIGKKDGLPWGYQYGKGVFEPTQEQKIKVLQQYKKLNSRK